MTGRPDHDKGGEVLYSLHTPHQKRSRPGSYAPKIFLPHLPSRPKNFRDNTGRVRKKSGVPDRTGKIVGPPLHNERCLSKPASGNGVRPRRNDFCSIRDRARKNFAGRLDRPKNISGSYGSCRKKFWRERDRPGAHIEKDRALARRFQTIEVPELNVDDTVKVLRGLRRHYKEFHGVTYSPRALRLAPSWPNATWPSASCPTKPSTSSTRRAPSSSCAAARDRRQRRQECSALARSRARHRGGAGHHGTHSAAASGSNDRERLRNLETEIKARIFGQDKAVEKPEAS